MCAVNDGFQRDLGPNVINMVALIRAISGALQHISQVLEPYGITLDSYLDYLEKTTHDQPREEYGANLVNIDNVQLFNDIVKAYM